MEQLTIYNTWVVVSSWMWAGSSAEDTLYLSQALAEEAAASHREVLAKVRTADVSVRVMTLDDWMCEMRSEARYEGERNERDSRDY